MRESTFTIPDTAFARSVVAEYPELADSKTDDFCCVTLLRHWAWSHTDYAPSAEAARLFQGDVAWQNSEAPEHFARFERGEGGVICGGTAKGLRKLYAHFGFRTWSFGCECEPGGPSHAVALVEIAIQGQPRTVVQDASFNVSLHDASSNEPLDVVDVIERLRERQHESIGVVESDFHTIKPWPRYVITPQFTQIHTPEHCLARDGYIHEGLAEYTTRDDGTVIFTSPRSWSHFIEKKCYNRQTGAPALTLAEIVDRGYPPSMLYLYRYPQWLEGPDGPTLMQKLNAASGKLPIA